MTSTRPIDFEIIKEPWNKYQISDNTVLKTRTILKRIDRVMDGGKVSFTMDTQTLSVIYADPSLRGTPTNRKITEHDIMSSIEKSDLRYDTIGQEFNEYNLDDGTRIKIFTNVTSVSRTTLRDKRGDPVYGVKSASTIEVKPADHYKSSGK